MGRLEEAIDLSLSLCASITMQGRPDEAVDTLAEEREEGLAFLVAISTGLFILSVIFN